MKITSHLVLGALAACTLLTLPACDDAKKDAAKADAGAAKADADKKAPADEKAEDGKAAADKEAEPPAADGAETKVADADGAGEDPPKIGVPECDEYVRVMTECFKKDVVPENLREAQREGFAVTVRGWADAVKTNAAAKDGVVVGCNAAADMAKRSFPKCFE